MDRSLFYTNITDKEKFSDFIKKLELYSDENNLAMYFLNKPLIETKDEYEFKYGGVLLIPNHKIIFINFSHEAEQDNFDDFVDEFIEDIGYIAKKFEFKKIIGRTKNWSIKYVERIHVNEIKDLENFLNKHFVREDSSKREIKILITLFIGSINSADRIGNEVPISKLQQIKRKVVLFDAQQTRFIFDLPSSKRISIQGLAGTGKTELLLNKIKETYTASENKIAFTCHNKVLADNLLKRVPMFFNYMKVEEQILWNERLWVFSSWGSGNDANSGMYSFICDHYNLQFERYSYKTPFNDVCLRALEKLNKIENFSPFLITFL